MMQKVLAVLVVAAVVACDASAPTAPVDPYAALIGNWTLVKLNHAPLPGAITNNSLTSIVSGSLVINSDHSFALNYSESVLDFGDGPRPSNGSLAGTVTDSSSLITFATGPASNGPGLAFNAIDSAGALIRFTYNRDVFDFVRQ